VVLDLEAADINDAYEKCAAQLRSRMDASGLRRAVGELGLDKVLAYLEAAKRAREVIVPTMAKTAGNTTVLLRRGSRRAMKSTICPFLLRDDL